MTSHGTQYVLPGRGPLVQEMPLPPMPPPEDDRASSWTTFIIEYDHRSDGGPRRVGPFTTREEAHGHAQTHAGPGWSASYSVVPVFPPEADS